MRCLRSFILLGIFAVPLCTSSIAYFIDIIPKTEHDTYCMDVNETVTFQAQGFQKDEVTGEVASSDLGKVWWDFHKGLFSKISSNTHTITLKAIKPGGSTLTAVGMVKDQSYTKTITIIVNGV